MDGQLHYLPVALPAKARRECCKIGCSCATACILAYHNAFELALAQVPPEILCSSRAVFCSVSTQSFCRQTKGLNVAKLEELVLDYISQLPFSFGGPLPEADEAITKYLCDHYNWRYHSYVLTFATTQVCTFLMC